jgi:uncharacterized protein YkwD
LVPRVRSLICLLSIPVLVLLIFSPLWGQEQQDEEIPLAIGFVTLDGTTGFVEFTGHAEEQPEITLSSIPAEPWAHELVRLTNQERSSRGIAPLKVASELMDAAQFHSDWMADHDCWGHECPGEPYWTTRIQDAGYLYATALAENIAAGYTSASSVLDTWMGSSGHRANMLSPDFREAGGGYAYSSTAYYHHYWTMDLGARKTCAQWDCPPVYPVAINNEAWSTDSLQVNLYVYGSGWASQMQFSNDGVNWSNWEPFSANKSWTLSGSGSVATVYAQITNGSATLQSSDEIYVDLPLSIQPDSMLFLSEQGTAATIPESYQMSITCIGSWSATAIPNWIELSAYSGSCPTAVTVSLQRFPTSPDNYTGTITVTSGSLQEDVQVTLVVTNDRLKRSYVPSTIKDY